MFSKFFRMRMTQPMPAWSLQLLSLKNDTISSKCVCFYDVIVSIGVRDIPCRSRSEVKRVYTLLACLDSLIIIGMAAEENFVRSATSGYLHMHNFKRVFSWFVITNILTHFNKHSIHMWRTLHDNDFFTEKALTPLMILLLVKWFLTWIIWI